MRIIFRVVLRMSRDDDNLILPSSADPYNSHNNIVRRIETTDGNFKAIGFHLVEEQISK